MRSGTELEFDVDAGDNGGDSNGNLDVGVDGDNVGVGGIGISCDETANESGVIDGDEVTEDTKKLSKKEGESDSEG
jgi:hypothetical protein